MQVNGSQNILVLGTDLVALGISVRAAGYNVFTVDHYGDQDLKRLSEKNLSVLAQEAGKSCGRFQDTFSPTALLHLAKELCARHRIDGVLLGAGLDDYPHIISELNSLAPIIGNAPNTFEKVRDKQDFFHELERLKIPHPETRLLEDFDLAKRTAKDIGYPVVIKPYPSLGGEGIRNARNLNELNESLRTIFASSVYDGVLLQEFVSGLNASLSILASGMNTQILTLNEQLLGLQKLGLNEPFGYCGNIVPATYGRRQMGVILKRCTDFVEKIVSHFGLAGSNGIDLVISDNLIPHVIEVNPRFQGTLECVERVLGINLASAHMNACKEGTISVPKKNRWGNFCVRLILYAHYRSIIPNLSAFTDIRDIPITDSIIEGGEPVCSLVIQEKTRHLALMQAEIQARRIYGELKPALQ